MAAIAITANTDTGVSFRTVKSDSVSHVQVVEMLLDMSSRTGYASGDGITITAASIVAGVLGSRRDGKAVTMNYVATYDTVTPAIPSQGAISLTSGLEYMLTGEAWDGTTLTLNITKLAVTEGVLATGTGTLPVFNQPFGIMIPIKATVDVPAA
jgi:hypothetical protein